MIGMFMNSRSFNQPIKRPDEEHPRTEGYHQVRPLEPEKSYVLMRECGQGT